jgi:dTDP-4-amino-4,6-dideoxygalactose transaminase
MNRQPAEAIPVNSLLRHTGPLQDALAAAADGIIRSGYFVLGPAVSEFEALFAGYCGVPHCIGVANGTDALELALKGVGVAAGDRVAVAANAAMYGTSAVLAAGAEPVFVDIDDDSAAMDPARLREAVTSHPDLKAVVVTHLYGRLAQVDALVAVAREAGIAVVEDCAQAHGARDAQGRMAGAFGDVASFSFYPTKNLGALGDGGAVVTADEDIAARVRRLRQYGWSAKYTNKETGGRNSRLDEIQAKMLSVMLPMLDGWNARRREIAHRYCTAIRHPDIRLPPTPDQADVAHLFVVRSARRDALKAHLADAGVQTDIHYPLPDHRQPCFDGRFAHVELPVTERHAGTVLTLPCFPELTDDEATRVIDACNRFGR